MPRNRLVRNSGRLIRAGALVAALASAFFLGQSAGARAPAPDVKALLSAGTTIAGEEIRYPAAAPARVTAVIVTLAPGAETGWHTHGVPAFGYILEGELTVDYGEKGQRTYRAGDALLEAVAHPHNGRNSGTSPMRILAVFMGADGLATTIGAAQK